MKAPKKISKPPSYMKIAGTPAEDQKEQRAVSKRWTKKLVEKGYTPVSNFFLENYHRLLPELSSPEVLLLIHLVSYKWDESMPYPGSKSLAKRMDISQTAVRGHLRSLHVRKKCLVRNKQTGSTNRYDLTPLFGKLEALLAADKLEAAKKVKQGAVA